MKNKLHIRYPAIFYIDTDGISISFPDIPECISCAFTKKQALNMAKDALELMLHNMKINNLPPQLYPLKRFSAESFFIRSITVKFNVVDNRLISTKVVEVYQNDLK